MYQPYKQNVYILDSALKEVVTWIFFNFSNIDELIF